MSTSTITTVMHYMTTGITYYYTRAARQPLPDYAYPALNIFDRAGERSL